MNYYAILCISFCFLYLRAETKSTKNLHNYLYVLSTVCHSVNVTLAQRMNAGLDKLQTDLHNGASEEYEFLKSS